MSVSVPIVFYSFVEDAVSRAVVVRLFDSIKRERLGVEIKFALWHPVVTNGCGDLKKRAKRFLAAAQSGVNSFFLTDLDAYSAPNDLGKDWFQLECLSQHPPCFVFRISVREIESWVMADRSAFASFLGVSLNLIPDQLDDLLDPKQFLLNLIRTKCKKKCYREMLPMEGQRVGIGYNSMLCDFVSKSWNPKRAAAHSASLSRSLRRISEVLKELSLSSC